MKGNETLFISLLKLGDCNKINGQRTRVSEAETETKWG